MKYWAIIANNLSKAGWSWAASQPVIGDFRIDTRTEIWITGRGEQNCAGNLGAALCVER
jgi:hypothetical protein